MCPGKGFNSNKAVGTKRQIKQELITRDWLAIDRTKMANERTFLAYFRTFIVILSSGVAILKVEVLQDMFDLGVFLVIIAPIVLFVGLVRFLWIRRHVKRYYLEKKT